MKYSQETYEKAINALEALKPTVTENEKLTVDFIVAALREKQERENPKPLTLDELREMGKTDWVWLTFPELPSEESGWYRAKQVYATYSHKHYGETWIAYCSRLKEAANG